MATWKAVKHLRDNRTKEIVLKDEATAIIDELRKKMLATLRDQPQLEKQSRRGDDKPNTPLIVKPKKRKIILED